MENKYNINKNKIRNKAIEWINYFADHNVSYSDILMANMYFTNYGKRYGLLKEFKINGII